MREKAPRQVTSAARGEASAARLAATLRNNLRQRAPRDDTELAEGGVPRLRRLDQALGDEPAAVVIAAMGQLPARLLQDDVHVRFGSLTQLYHDARPVRVACNRKHTHKDVV